MGPPKGRVLAWGAGGDGRIWSEVCPRSYADGPSECIAAVADGRAVGGAEEVVGRAGWPSSRNARGCWSRDFAVAPEGSLWREVRHHECG